MADVLRKRQAGLGKGGRSHKIDKVTCLIVLCQKHVESIKSIHTTASVMPHQMQNNQVSHTFQEQKHTALK